VICDFSSQSGFVVAPVELNRLLNSADMLNVLAGNSPMASVLFPDGNHLPLWRRIAYRTFIVAGAATLFFILLAVVVEIVTNPRANPKSVAIALVSAVFAAGHVIWESCTDKPLSLSRWLAFVVALSVFGYLTWININDPTAKRMLLYIPGGAGLLLLIGRLLFTTYRHTTRGLNAELHEEP
jgi:hypothetical protein